jgi:hypothetical protein
MALGSCRPSPSVGMPSGVVGGQLVAKIVETSRENTAASTVQDTIQDQPCEVLDLRQGSESKFFFCYVSPSQGRIRGWRAVTPAAHLR